MQKLIAVGTSLLIPCLGAPGQAPTPRPLDPPTAELVEPVSSVAGLRELSNGRVVFLDSRERSLWITDAAMRSVTKIGREGQGPQEYARPSGVIAMPGDTTWIADGGNNRHLVIGPTGVIIGSQEQIAIRPSESVTYYGSTRGTDAQGRLYMVLPFGLIDRGPDDKGDTPILRYDRGTQRFDTIATFNDPTRIRAVQQPQRVTTTGGMTMGFGASVGAGYGGKDDWAPASDGAIAIVRWQPYRVEWRTADGRAAQGAEVAYTKVRVGSAEKEEFLSALRARGGGSMTTRGADGRTQAVQLPVPEPETWAEFKPPFVSGSAIAAPDHTVWVQRSVSAAAKDAIWDVFDRHGRIVRQVVLPKRSRVLGFGSGTVYVSRVDDDDLLYIGRHAMPR